MEVRRYCKSNVFRPGTHKPRPIDPEITTSITYKNKRGDFHQILDYFVPFLDLVAITESCPLKNDSSVSLERFDFK